MASAASGTRGSTSGGARTMIKYHPDVVELGEEYVLKKVPKVESHQGVYFPVSFGDIYSPWKFFLQLHEDKAAFSRLEASMNQYYDYDKSEKFRMTDLSYFPGHPCVALYSNMWQRAKFISSENGEVTVKCVDFGGIVTVGAEKVRLLKRDFFHLAAQAIPSQMYGIKPAGGAKTWPLKASKGFLELTKTGHPLVGWLQADTTRTRCERISVCVYNTSTDIDVNLSDLLIEAKLAEVDYEQMTDYSSDSSDDDDDNEEEEDEEEEDEEEEEEEDLSFDSSSPPDQEPMANASEASPKTSDFVSIPGDLLDDALLGNHTAQATIQKMIAQNVNHIMSAWALEGANYCVKEWDQNLLLSAAQRVLPSPAPYPPPRVDRNPLLSSAQNELPSAPWNGLRSASASQNLLPAASEAAKPSSWNTNLKTWAITAPQWIPPKRDQLMSINQPQEAAVSPRSFLSPVASAPCHAANRRSVQQPKLVLERMQRKPVKTLSWAEVADQPAQPAHTRNHVLKELECDLDELDIGDVRFVMPVELLPGKVVHIVNMEDSACLVSTEVSAFFPEWNGQDLYDMLGRRGFTVPHLDVDSKSFEPLFCDLLRHKVPGIINPLTGQPKKYLKLYKLRSVPQILLAFKCQDHNLWRAIHEQDVAFRSGDPYWRGL